MENQQLYLEQLQQQLQDELAAKVATTAALEAQRAALVLGRL
jgi:hypothetical protein